MAFDLFLGWIKTLVYQLFGKRELECQCWKCKDLQIDIVILAVNSDRPSHQAPSWQDIENLLFELVNPESDFWSQRFWSSIQYASALSGHYTY